MPRGWLPMPRARPAEKAHGRCPPRCRSQHSSRHSTQGAPRRHRIERPLPRLPAAPSQALRACAPSRANHQTIVVKIRGAGRLHDRPRQHPCPESRHSGGSARLPAESLSTPFPGAASWASLPRGPAIAAGPHAASCRVVLVRAASCRVVPAVAASCRVVLVACFPCGRAGTPVLGADTHRVPR